METKTSTTPTTTKPRLTYIKRGLSIIALIGVGWLVSYSLEQYHEQDGENIFICDQEDCFQTTHIHADVEFDLCGETLVLPRETGELDGLHTHKEKNYLHFHDRVDIDRAAFETSGEKLWLYEDSLSAQEIIDIFELDPEKYCGTDNVEITVYVNDEIPEEGLEYNRVDGDEILLEYNLIE